MQVFFIGQIYIDVVFIIDYMLIGDEKYVVFDYVVFFGGNVVMVVFCCVKFGIVLDLIVIVVNDWLGCMFQDMCVKYVILLYGWKVNQFLLFFIMFKDGKCVIVCCCDDEYIYFFLMFNFGGCCVLYVDGYQFDVVIYYVKVCCEVGILILFDGGGLCINMYELLEFIDVVIVVEWFCEQMDLMLEKMFDYFKGCGCKIGGVIMGEKGLFWYDEIGVVQVMLVMLILCECVIDINGVGDVFYGVYVYFYFVYFGKSWCEYFDFVCVVLIFKIQCFGNEVGLLMLVDIVKVWYDFEVWVQF